MEYFSNFGAPLYEGFQDEIAYDQVDAEVLKFHKNGNLLVKLTLPKDEYDNEDIDNVSKEVKLTPQKDNENMNKLEQLQSEFNKHAPLNDDDEKDASILEAPKDELQVKKSTFAPFIFKANPKMECKLIKI